MSGKVANNKLLVLWPRCWTQTTTAPHQSCMLQYSFMSGEVYIPNITLFKKKKRYETCSLYIAACETFLQFLNAKPSGEQSVLRVEIKFALLGWFIDFSEYNSGFMINTTKQNFPNTP